MSACSPGKDSLRETTPRDPVYIGVGLAAVLIVAGIGGLIYIGRAPVQEPPESLQVPWVSMKEVEFDYRLLDRVCRKYVDEVGLVDYAGLKRDAGDLQSFLDQVAAVSPHSNIATFSSEQEALAYWINAYNAWMMKAVLDAYPKNPDAPPLKSVNDISEDPDVFNTKGRICGGENLSLSDIEHGIVRKQFLEPRVHFALNCASMGCPWLPQEAFDPLRLEEQLDRETRRFFQDMTHLMVDPENQVVFLSSILKWYQEDFVRWLQEERGVENPSVLDYVKLYAPEEVAAQIEPDFDIQYQSYDWNLNDQNAEWAALRR